MITAIIGIFILLIIWLIVRIFRLRIFASEADLCLGEKPLYIFVITSAGNASPLVSEINKLCTKTKGLAYVVMIVNDTDPHSDYSKRAKMVVRSMLIENRDTGYHPVLVFKTSKEYRKFFTKSFSDICIVKDFSQAQDLVFQKCPGM